MFRTTAQTHEALLGAAYAGDVRAVRALLSGSAGSVAGFINGKDDENGAAALHMASQRGHPEVVRLLLGKGADLQAEDNDGRTPPDYAKDDATREVFR
mmetsp:Transcript_27003/g.59740  ORF Transcript_27003/g.59740 Transcript_27003/m.59740 type:complete len:98 (+) Transcript_27003:434-727(+)